MNRWLMAAVIGLMAVGCAAGVEDPQPPPGPDPVQKEPPAQTFSGGLQQVNEVMKGAGTGEFDVPAVPVDMPPMPGQN